MIKEFFKEIDNFWKPIGEEPIELSTIGSTALFLQSSYSRGTKDSDILESKNLSPHIPEKLEKLAGIGSRLAQKHKMYLDIVKSALTFLPAKPLFHPIDANLKLTHFRIRVLDVVDVVVSKLKTFRAQDVDDIHSMVKLKLVDRGRLVDRFKLAMDRWLLDSRALDLPVYIENLHAVERDFLRVDETPIELPRWIDTP